MGTKGVDDAELRRSSRHMRQVLPIGKSEVRIHAAGKPSTCSPIEKTVHLICAGLERIGIRYPAGIENACHWGVNHAGHGRTTREWRLRVHVLGPVVHEKMLEEVACGPSLVAGLLWYKRRIRSVRNCTIQQTVPGRADLR